MRTGARAVVNTNFLLNTVHGIGSHNRREEVEECWRQRRLEQQQDHKQGNEGNATRKRQREVTYQKTPIEQAVASVDDTRTFWAEQKQRAMAGTATGASSAMAGAISTVQTGTMMERRRNKTKLGEGEGCDSDSRNRGAKLLRTKKKKRKKRDQKKDNNCRKKNKDSKKEKRKREGQDARDVDDYNVEESQHKQNSELESDVVGSGRKHMKNKKSTSKRHKKTPREDRTDVVSGLYAAASAVDRSSQVPVELDELLQL
eukprot:jgi/Undpi1/3086/HiC_scaffold_15.g06460.m1